MKTTVKCTRCGKHNDVARIFCTHCGTKLSVDKVKFGETGWWVRISRWFTKLLRWAMFLALCALLVLLLWAPDPAGEMGDESEGQAAFDKLADLYELIQMNGRGARAFSEREANAYVIELIQDAVPPLEGSALQMQLEVINFRFQPDSVVVQVNAAWRGITLAHSVTGVPVIEDGAFRLEVQQAQLGRIPMPARLHQLVTQRIVPVFASMEREQAVLDNISAAELRAGAVRLTVGEPPSQRQPQ